MQYVLKTLFTLCTACLALADTQPIQINESWFTTEAAAENVDSIAVWDNREGDVPWMLVTAKASHCLHVYDASNGQFLKRVGGQGAFPGQLDRPNGLFVINDLLLVVERDNQRVQVFKLPEFEPLTSFGQDVLIKPYGLWVQQLPSDPEEPNAELYQVFVTDNYEFAEGARTADGEIPPATELGDRIRVFTLEREAGTAEGELDFSFGDTSGPGMLRIVESIYGDPSHDHLIISEEDPIEGSSLKIYTLKGKFTGERIGQDVFKFQSEGIVLDTKNNWVIATDQGKQANYFHAFDREIFKYIASFSGNYTLNTDGACLFPQAIGPYAGGLFFAINNDKQVAAFDWDVVSLKIKE
ncbi:MAG: phytase [Opitutales bacterium]